MEKDQLAIEAKVLRSSRWRQVITFQQGGTGSEVVLFFSFSLCLQETEVVNTAILTGRRLAVPIKLVTVETDGQVREVDDSVTCSSTDVDVVKVRWGTTGRKQRCCLAGR